MRDRGAWCRFLLCVQCNLLWGFRLMTCGAGPLQYAPHSRVLSCVPLDCVSQCTIDSVVSRSQSCGSHRVVLRCELAVAPGQFTGTGTRDNPHWDPIVRRLLCEGGSSLPCFPSALLQWSGAPPLHSDLGVERIVTAIWGPGSGSHLEYSTSVPPPRLGHSPDVRRPCLDRQSLAR